MPDLARLERELMSGHPEPWVRHHLASFPGDFFDVFRGPELSRHLELMQGLSDERPVAVHARPDGGGVWRVDVVGYDAFQFLSTLCTLFAVRGLSILEGRVFTSKPPPPEAPAPAPRRVPAPRRLRGPPRRRAPTGGPGSWTSSASVRSASRTASRTGPRSRPSSSI